MKYKRVLVALSGGVDSSVCAALLCDDGYEVVGVTCVFSDDPPVPGDAAINSAKAVAEKLGIEHHIVDARARFEHNVLEPFACGYAKGMTPNPCIVCNPTTKFGVLFDTADELGCEVVATGHYALCEAEEGLDGTVSVALRRGSDEVKDQSYFLYRLTPRMLARLMFPLAGLTKEQVRALAREHELPTAETPESQDVCFAADESSYRSIISRYAPEAFIPGDIVDEDGNVLGQHTGIANYTIGQRKGLGIAAAYPLYVISIDADSNTVIVGPSKRLKRTGFTACDVVLHQDVGDGDVTVKIRHGMEPVCAHIRLETDLRGELKLFCEVDDSLSGIASGQSVVCYREDIVVCGGIIE